MKPLLITLVVLSLTAFALAPDDQSDAYLLQQHLAVVPGSASTEEFAELNFDPGYVVGAAHAYNYENVICLPSPSPRNGEFSQVVKKYLDDHPTVLHENRIGVVRDALRQAYPCSKRNE